jgi:N utilization substance protein A
MLDLKTLKPLIRQIAEEKGLTEDKVFDALEVAFAAAYKKEYGKKMQVIRAKIDPDDGQVKFSQIKIVVDESSIIPQDEEETDSIEKRNEYESNENEDRKIKFNPERHILLEEAKKIKSNVKIDDEIITPLEVKSDFSRIAAQTAKQVILQKLKELEKETILSGFKEKEDMVIGGIIQRIERKNIYVDLGKTFGVLYANEGIPGEHLK